MLLSKFITVIGKSMYGMCDLKGEGILSGFICKTRGSYRVDHWVDGSDGERE